LLKQLHFNLFFISFCAEFAFLVYNFGMNINIGAIGYNYTHEEDFRMDRPDGPGAWLFLLVKSDAIFYINGKRNLEKKHSYVLLQPKTPCMYQGAKENYEDDWFFFNMTEEDKTELLERGIVFDSPVFLGSTEEISSLIHQISYNHFSADIYHEEIKILLTSVLFLKTAQQAKSKIIQPPDVLAGKNDRLTYLRTRLFEEPALFSGIDEMAAYMNLSRSGFQHLYSHTFGVSVIHDVIKGRIEKAKSFLSKSNYSITEISNKCGYKSEFHFMRQFKKETGLTPTEFRRSSSWTQIEKSR
jgi:AraC family transcriptional regulator of arabinose operon